MFSLFDANRARLCDGVSRREFLRAGGLGVVGGGSLLKWSQSAGSSQPCPCEGKALHHLVPARWTATALDMGPEAECTGRNTRRLRGHSHQTFPGLTSASC